MQLLFVTSSISEITERNFGRLAPSGTYDIFGLNKLVSTEKQSAKFAGGMTHLAIVEWW